MIADHDKHLKAIERGEQKLQRHTDIMRAIAEKMERCRNPWQVWVGGWVVGEWVGWGTGGWRGGCAGWPGMRAGARSGAVGPPTPTPPLPSPVVPLTTTGA